MIEISEVLYQWQQGRSKSRIAESLGITRPTVRNYLNQAVAAGLTACSSADEASVIAAHVSAKVSGNKSAAPVLDAISAHEEQIKAWLEEKDMTAKQIWRLLSESGHPFSERSINRYVQRIAPSSPSVTVRLEVDPGTQAQVDFGQVMLTLGGVRRRLWAFVLTLSYSRPSVPM
jgi:DNA-binding CsgD family transcriptional regulator